MTYEFETLPDLASRTLRGGGVDTNDEFFAAADHLLSPHPPTFTKHVFDHRGQVYDGWETRRRREPGHDYVIVWRGAPALTRGIEVDTAFSTGTYPPPASVDACSVAGYPDAAALKAARWT